MSTATLPESHPLTQNGIQFTEAFEELAKLFTLLTKKTSVTADGKVFQVALERDMIRYAGFGMSLTGLMLGILDHQNTMSITCKITVGYILPKLPVQYVTINGTYCDGWKLKYEE